MSNTFNTLEPAIQNQLRALSQGGGLPGGNDVLEMLASGWLEKERAFLDQARQMDMQIVEKVADKARGFLALTYSGSLLAVGPDEGPSRRAVYVSIDRRRDVPSRAESEDTVLNGRAEVGKEIAFKKGPVKKSSAVYRLAVLPESLALPDQNVRLEEATLTLAREFQTVDKTVDQAVDQTVDKTVDRKDRPQA